MKAIFTTILLITSLSTTYSQILDSAKVKGTLINATEKFIKIGDTNVSIAHDGTFIYTTNFQYHNFIDVSYGDLSWSIYLEPGKIINFEIKAGDLSSLTYLDDLKVSNDFLKNLSLLNINKEINNFFNKNWQRIYSQDEDKFISTIDSLKQVFIKFLIAFQNEHVAISKDFIKLFTADVNFGLNSLILQYPENHKRYTGQINSLNQKCIDYLKINPIDDVHLLDLKSYKDYCKSWIDYNADFIINKNNEHKHYSLKKMDVLFKYIPSIFKNQIIIDFWLSEFLNEQIENTWLPNSEKYIKEFNKVCKTSSYKERINKVYNSYLDSEKDHIVKVYKSINGFILEAHIFYPKGINKSEKKPAIVIFHGGGLVLGNPSWAFTGAKRYADMGMIAISAQYRLCNFKDVTPIDAFEDARDLMFWLRKNSDSLGILDNKIAASGWSMGAQLCASLAIFPDTLFNTKIISVPNALLLTSPGTNSKGWFTELLNGEKVNPEDYSPVDHIKTGLPPTIILQGRDDTQTPLKDVQEFHDKMVEKENYCEIWIYDNVGHLFTPTILGDRGWPRPDKEVQQQADKKAVDFLRKFGYIIK